MEMTEAAAIDFFAELFGGKHHIPGRGVKQFGPGWSVNCRADLATYDFNMLTRLVFLAHDKCIRAEVSSSGPRMVKISIWQRRTRNEGEMWSRHPTIETALENWRKRHQSCEPPANADVTRERAEDSVSSVPCGQATP